MPDRRPIQDRFDVLYTRRRHWPDSINRVLMWVAILVGGGWLLVLAVRGDNRLYSSGQLTSVHQMIAGDCASCHQPSPGGSAGSRYWMPVQDSACLKCHVNAAVHHDSQSHFVGAWRDLPSMSRPVLMASNCAACHVEHHGRDADLKLVPDSVCVQCHRNLDAFGLAAGESSAPSMPPSSPSPQPEPSVPPAEEGSQ